MAETLLWICVILLVVLLPPILIILITLWRKPQQTNDASPIINAIAAAQERNERTIREEIGGQLRDNRTEQTNQLDRFSTKIDALTKTLDDKQSQFQRDTQVKLDTLSNESFKASASVRNDVTQALAQYSDTMKTSLAELGGHQRMQLANATEQIGKLTQTIDTRMEALRVIIDARLKDIQEKNDQKLDQMRQMVDDKLQKTLETRLDLAFKQVSERLESVSKGLGEMQTLASGVGDLKKVLTNVRTRGTWGEVQLAALLEQVLSTEQYQTNVAIHPNSNERVEFAIKLPGPGESTNDAVYLPIDAKFPMDKYQSLLDAQEKADADLAKEAGKELENSVYKSAADIKNKYISPPLTTDFAILFLPTEGLFAEVLRRPGLAEKIQREHRVVIAGPTTLWSILNSMLMGFRTLAIQKRASEVWSLLSAVKTEWQKYGEAIETVKKRLQQSINEIDKVDVRTRAIDRQLKKVQELPTEQATKILAPDETSDDPA